MRGTPLRIRKVASRPGVSTEASSSAIARCSSAPLSWGTSAAPSDVKVSARPISSPVRIAWTGPACTVTGAETAARANAMASSVASGEMTGGTTSMGAWSGLRGSRKASWRSVVICTASRDCPGCPSLTRAVPSRMTIRGSTAGRAIASAIWVTSLARAVSSTAGTRGRSRSAEVRSAMGFQTLPNAGSTDAIASTERPACEGLIRKVRPSARTRSCLSRRGAVWAETAAAASSGVMPEMSTPPTTVPDRAVPPDDRAAKT